MSEFDKRKRSAEAVFATEQELRFKAVIRGFRRGATWAADQIGKTGADLDAYVENIVSIALGNAEQAARDLAVAAITADLGSRATEAEVIAQLAPVTE